MKPAVWLSIVSAALLGLAGTAEAQTATGQITGVMRDATGAVIPDVKITVTNQNTGLTRETTTGATGSYTIPYLPVGMYSVAAEKPGFNLARRSDIRLNVDQVIRVDLELAIGEVTQTIEVQAAAAAIDTDTSTVGHVVTQRQVTELPLNGRNFLQLLFLGAGAVETTGEQGSMRQGVGDAISINGARPTSNNYMLDGTANTDTALNTPAIVLSVDAIQEFKEQTSTYSAEYGFSANQINIISRSGTNSLHGSVFWFLRNDALDARSFFQRSIAPLRQNQFGFVAGGPLYVPKVYDGRNKTFWLANYEGARIRRGIDRFANVPSADMLAGRFSTTVTDPVTGQPFPNNVVPETRFSRIGNQARQKYFPAPSIDLPQGNYRDTKSLPNDTNQQTYRFDQMLGRFGTVFGRVTWGDFTNTAAGTISPGGLGEVFFRQETQNWQVSHTLTIGPAIVNQFRFGYVEFTANQFGTPATQADVDALGITGIFTNLADTQRAYPTIGFQSGGWAGVGGNVNATTLSNQPMWDVSNGTTVVRGNHSFGFGASYRRWKLNRDLANNFLGVYSYSGDFSGHPIADLLLGYYQRIEVWQPTPFSDPSKAGNPRQMNFQYFAPYFQDDWKVSQRLTLNLGLRWDFRTMPYETRNHFGWWNPGDPLGGMFVADEKLQELGVIGSGYSMYTFAGRRTPHDASKNVWAPRFGFAFRPFGGDRTVVRGGYGIFFDSSEEREIDGAADIYPYVSRIQLVQTLGQLTPLMTTDQLFPSSAEPRPVRPADNSFLAVSQSHRKQNPYVQQWSLSIQRALSSSMTLELNYLGNKGTHLLMRHNFVQALPPDYSIPLNDPRNTVAARKPYPNFVTYINSLWGGNSSYNSFNVKFERRTSTMIFTSVYTWAKSLDNKSAAAGIGSTETAGWQGFLNNHNVRLDRARSGFDVDHRLVTSFVYQIPVGRGGKYLNNIHRAADMLVGGWQVNGIVMFQRGFPYTVTGRDIGGLLDTFGTNRADITGDPELSDPTIARWFNTAAFAQPQAAYFGTSGRSILRAPGINNWDLGLFKNFRFTENLNLQFRFESFNAWNHTQWGTPNRDVNSPQFGQVTGARAGRINQFGLKFLW